MWRAKARRAPSTTDAVPHAVRKTPPVVDEVVSTAGQPLDAQVRSHFEGILDRDFSDVRIHTDERAARSAASVDAFAYARGNHVVFGTGTYRPDLPEGRELIEHELAHVAEGGSEVRRAPLPDTSKPRTFILAYGSGQRNTVEWRGDLGRLLEMAANQKKKDIVARLGKKASTHTIVLAYTPTEAELQKVLNATYEEPIAEVHLFSHGWEAGINLGGPVSTPRAESESAAVTEQRRVVREDLGGFTPNLAEDAVFTLYGCNIGNAKAAKSGVPIAQDVADQFGVAVTASTSGTWFKNQGGGMRQVPQGGKMVDFTPSPTGAKTTTSQYLDALAKLLDIQRRQRELDQPGGKMGLLGHLIRESRLREQAEAAEKNVAQLRPLAHRALRFVPADEQAAVRAKIEAAETSALLRP